MVQTTLDLCRFVWPTKGCHDNVNDNNENRQKKSWKIKKQTNNKQVYLETQLNQCKVIEAPNKLDQTKRVSVTNLSIAGNLLLHTSIFFETGRSGS